MGGAIALVVVGHVDWPAGVTDLVSARSRRARRGIRDRSGRSTLELRQESTLSLHRPDEAAARAERPGSVDLEDQAARSPQVPGEPLVDGIRSGHDSTSPFTGAADARRVGTVPAGFERPARSAASSTPTNAATWCSSSPSSPRRTTQAPIVSTTCARSWSSSTNRAIAALYRAQQIFLFAEPILGPGPQRAHRF